MAGKYDPQAHAALLRQLEQMEMQRQANEQAEAEAEAKARAEAEAEAEAKAKAKAEAKAKADADALANDPRYHASVKRMKCIQQIYTAERQMREDGTMSAATWNKSQSSWQSILAIFKKEFGFEYVPEAQTPSPSANDKSDPSARGHSRTEVPMSTVVQQKKEGEVKAKKEEEVKVKKEQEEKAKLRALWGLGMSMHAGNRIATLGAQVVPTRANCNVKYVAKEAVKRQIDGSWVLDRRTHSQIVADVRALFVANKLVVSPEVPDTADCFLWVDYSGKLDYANGDGKCNPAQYGTSVECEFFLCFVTFCTRGHCRHGKLCIYRHDKLAEIEVKQIAVSQQGREWLVKYQENWAYNQIPERTGFPLAPAPPEDKDEQERLIKANTRFERHFAGARGGARGGRQPQPRVPRPDHYAGPNTIIRKNDEAKARGAKEAFGEKEKQAKYNLSATFVQRNGASAPTHHGQGSHTAAPAATQVPAAEESIDPAYLDENGEFDPERAVLTDEKYRKMPNH